MWRVTAAPERWPPPASGGAQNSAYRLARPPGSPRGAFIVFEGIDGSGLTTQALRLRQWCRRHRLSVHLTREPSPGRVGRLVRRLLRNGPGPLDQDERLLALLFAADRAEHLQREIRPRLDAGTHVVCDRYLLSSLAYQSVTLPVPWLQALNSPFPAPDLTVLLVVPPEIALRRIATRGQPRERYETGHVLEQVIARYQELAAEAQGRGEAVAMIDGRGSPREVGAGVVAAAVPYLQA